MNRNLARAVNRVGLVHGIELMRMIRKGQLMMERCKEEFFVEQLYALAGKSASFEKLALVPTNIMLISWQYDTTAGRRWPNVLNGMLPDNISCFEKSIETLPIGK